MKTILLKCLICGKEFRTFALESCKRLYCSAECIQKSIDNKVEKDNISNNN